MPRFLLPAALLAFAAIAGCTPTPSAEPSPPAGPYDLVIAGATVFDGTGAEGIAADIGIVGDRITAVSRQQLPTDQAGRVIDGTGLYLAPGFIDVHAHLEPLLQIPDAESHVRQGVTTALGGPDGTSPWPLADFLTRAGALGLGMNVAFTIGHNTVRREVMGLENRPATPAELETMKGMVARAMGEGAWGISTGLIYLPGAFSDLDEVVALSAVAADSNGFYTSHMRDEGLGLIASMEETIEIGRRARLPVVVTHHKVVGRPMWGRSVETLAMVDRARAEGIDVRLDQYPYTATHTGIAILVPEWAQAGGDAAFVQRLSDPVLADSIFRGIVFNIVNDRGGDDLRRVQFSGVDWDRSLEGRTLYDWAVREGKPATAETGAELVIEAMKRGGARTIFHALEEEDVQRIMRHPQTMIASDGRLVRAGDGHPHPRWYGTFPRVLGRYTRELGVLTWSEAIHKMTGMPADLLGLADRGTIREGAFADLVLFDPARIADRSTFEDPHHFSDGIDYVLVNGVVTVDAGEFQAARAGRVLRRGPDGGRLRR